MGTQETLASQIASVALHRGQLSSLRSPASDARRQVLTSFIGGLTDAAHEIEWDVEALDEPPVFQALSEYVRDVRQFLYEAGVQSHAAGKGPMTQARQTLAMLAVHEQLAKEYHDAEEERRRRGLEASQKDTKLLQKSCDEVVEAVQKFIKAARDSLTRQLG